MGCQAQSRRISEFSPRAAIRCYTYNQGLQDYDCFGIPKGAPNLDLAMKVIAEMSKAEYQADIPQYITYGPTNSNVALLLMVGVQVASARILVADSRVNLLQSAGQVFFMTPVESVAKYRSNSLRNSG